MSLTTAGDVLTRVITDAPNSTIQALIDEIEADITAAIGAPYTSVSATISETVMGGFSDLFLRRPILSIDTVTEYGLLSASSGTALTAGTHFFTWNDQGRLTRLPAGSSWGERVDVAYVPRDQRARRKGAVIDLVRLRLAMTPMKSESISGEFSYTAPDNWEAELQKVLRRLSFREV